MSFEDWLTRLDPGQVSFSVMMVMAVGLFIWRKVWPWLTGEYWPARVARQRVLDQAQVDTERARTAVMAMMRDTVVELKVIAAQQMALLAQQRDDWQDVSKIMLDQQRTILDFVESLKAESLKVEVRDHAARR